MLDEDQKSIFTNWLEEHGSSVMKVARAYTLTSEESPGSRSGNLASSVAVAIAISREGKCGDVVLSCGSAHRHELASQGQAATNQATTADGSANCGDWTSRTVPSRFNSERPSNNSTKPLHQLPQTDAALVLLYLDELSYREMAEVLGISENHVGVKLNRAKKALAMLLNSHSQ